MKSFCKLSSASAYGFAPGHHGSQFLQRLSRMNAQQCGHKIRGSSAEAGRVEEVGKQMLGSKTREPLKEGKNDRRIAAQ